MQRIVSLLPSHTEIVCALGLEEALVGRSHECDHPPSVRSLPACTEPRFDTDGTSGEIDSRVKQLVRDGLSVYRVDTERLRELAPDLILTQDQCEVCAASLAEVERAVAEWAGDGSRPRVLSMAPARLDEVWDSIGQVAEAAGVAERGRELVASLRARVQAIGEQCSSGLDERPKVACLEWLDPLMGAGSWIPDLVEKLGGEPLFADPGGPSRTLQWEALRDADPDVIVAMPCGFDLVRTRSECNALAQLPGWEQLRAVREDRVYVVDGNAYMNRPGPRLVESMEILAESLHPEESIYGHEGTGWQYF